MIRELKNKELREQLIKLLSKQGITFIGEYVSRCNFSDLVSGEHVLVFHCEDFANRYVLIGNKAMSKSRFYDKFSDSLIEVLGYNPRCLNTVHIKRIKNILSPCRLALIL